MKCPKCHSKNVRPLFWGMPTYEAYSSGKFYIGGCCIPEDIFDYGCLDCDHLWYLDGFNASDIKMISVADAQSFGFIDELETMHMRIKTTGQVLSYTTVGRSRKWNNRKDSIIKKAVYDELAAYLFSVIMKKKVPKYDDFVCDGNMFTVKIYFPDGRWRAFEGSTDGSEVGETVFKSLT